MSLIFTDFQQCTWLRPTSCWKCVFVQILVSKHCAICLGMVNIAMTRMHSSKIHTACLLLISPSMHCSEGCTWWRVPAQGAVLAQGVPAWGCVYLLVGCTCQGWCTWPGWCAYPGGVLARGCICLGSVPAQGVYMPGGCTCPGGVHAWGMYLPRDPGRGYLPRYSPPL